MFNIFGGQDLFKAMSLFLLTLRVPKMKRGYKTCWRAEAGAKQGWDELPKKGVIVPLMNEHPESGEKTGKMLDVRW